MSEYSSNTMPNKMRETEYCKCYIHNSNILCSHCESSLTNVLSYSNLSPSLLHIAFSIKLSITGYNGTNCFMRVTNLPYYLLKIYCDARITIILAGYQTRNYKFCADYYQPTSYNHFINNYDYLHILPSDNDATLHFNIVSYPSLALKSMQTFHVDTDTADYYPPSLTLLTTGFIMNTICDNLPPKLLQHATIDSNYYEYMPYCRYSQCPRIASIKIARNWPIYYKEFCTEHI